MVDACEYINKLSFHTK